MHEFLVDMLECPLCHQTLEWQIKKRLNDHIELADARCLGCNAVYPVRDGIGIFITPDLPRNDLWEQVESQIVVYLQDHPDLERQLMDPSIGELSPTDQFFRALVLEERGDLVGSRELEKVSNQNLYTPAHLDCYNSQMQYLLEAVATVDGPVVDLASGRCYLVEKVIERLKRPVVASDFSLRALRRARLVFDFVGFEEYVSLLAFDARQTPFRDGSIKTMTTNLGLPNIEKPGRLLYELNRIIDGTLLAISHFFPADDEPNKKAIEVAGLDPLLYKRSAIENFISAGWSVEVENSCRAESLPTPESMIFREARVDGLPVAPTELEWCVLRATN